MEAWWKPARSTARHHVGRRDHQNAYEIGRSHDRVMIHQPQPTLAMQKVEGSSPFSRLSSPGNPGLFLCPNGADRL
jgi:hypothetical protein